MQTEQGSAFVHCHSVCEPAVLFHIAVGAVVGDAHCACLHHCVELVALVLTVARLDRIGDGGLCAWQLFLYNSTVGNKFPVDAVALLILLIMRSEHQLGIGIIEGEAETVAAADEMVVYLSHEGSHGLSLL